MHPPRPAVKSHQITPRRGGERPVERRLGARGHIHAIETAARQFPLEFQGVGAGAGHIVFEIHENPVLIVRGVIYHGVASGREHIPLERGIVAGDPVAASVGENLKLADA